MDYPILMQKVWNCPFCILRGIFLYILNGVFLFWKIVFILANSADPDELPLCMAFHLDLHCLPKYLFTGILNEKG